MDSIIVRNNYRNIVQLALPVLISMLIPQLSMLTNTTFLGNYIPSVGVFGQQDLLAASGIAGIYYLTMVMVGYGLSSGLLMLMSRKAGEDDYAGLGKLMSNGMVLSLGLSCVMLLLSYVLAPMIFNFAIHEERIRESAIGFMGLRMWGLPLIVLGQLGNVFFLATSNSKLIIAGSIVQTVLNIVFDYLLIFGHWGFEEMGLDGSAIASVIADGGYLVTNALLLLLLARFKKFDLRFFTLVDWALCKEILIKSSPLIVQFFLSIGAWEVFFIYVEHLGKAESAISQILRSVFGIVGVATWALGSTCNSMVSNLIGQGKLQEVIPMIERIVKVSLSFSIVVGLMLLIFPNYFLSLLTNDALLVEKGSSSLRIVVLAVWMLSVSTIYFNGLLGTGNTRLNMVFELVAIMFYVVYITIVIEWLRLPLPYAWASEFVYWLSLFCLSSYYLYSGKWKKFLMKG